jgi:drug/metabolite transporter (DMT)-like permease
VPATDPAAAGQRPLLAASWIGAAICCWTLSSVLVRLLENRVAAYDLSFFRACVSVAVTLPLLWQFRAGGGNAMPRQAGFGAFLARGVLVFAGQLAIYYAIPHLPLGDSTVLNASVPIFIAILAPLVLGERVDALRWAAILAGFLGVVVVIRPGFADFSLPMLAALGSAAFFGASAVLSKKLTRTEPPLRIVCYTNLTVVLLAAMPFLVWGGIPAWSDVPLVLAVSAAGALAQYSTAKAFSAADAGYVGPIEFARVPVAALAGWIVFAEMPTVWLALGSLLIFGSV